MKKVLTLLAGIAVLMSACSKESGGGSSVAPTPSNPMQQLSNMQKSGAVNLTEVNNMYLEQLALAQGGDPEAKLYASVLGFAVLANNAQMESLMVWNDINPDSIPVDSGSGLFKSVSATGLFKGNMLSADVFKCAPKAQAALGKSLAAELLPNYPKVSAVQDTLEKVLLPIIDQGIGFLTDISNSGSFSVTIELDEDTIEVDMTEARILLAGLQALKVYVTSFIAYDLDFDKDGSYEYLNSDSLTAEIGNKLIALMDPVNSGFLKVRSSQKQSLLDANPALVIAAANNVKLALDYCKAETDPQSNDIIPNDDPDFDSVYNDALDVIDSIKGLMTGPTTVTVKDTTIRVDYSHTFNIPDLKAMLPYYQIVDYSLWHSSPYHTTYIDSYQVYMGGYWDANLQQYIYNYQMRYDTNETIFPVNFQNAGGATLVNGAKGMDELDSLMNVNAMQIRDLSSKIIFKDPTFHGVLPGMTNDALWSVIQKVDEENSVVDTVYATPVTTALKQSAEPAALLAKLIR